MQVSWLLRWSLAGVALVVGACAGPSANYVEDPGDSAWLDGKADGASGVNVQATHLEVDLATKTATATIELEKYGSVELEAGGLTITRVSDERGRRHFSV